MPGFNHASMGYRVGVSLPGIEGIEAFRLLSKPSGQPVATAAAIREADGQRALVALVLADLDAAAIRRIRAECGRLEAILTGIDPAVVLPLLDHGVNDRGRPYLAAACPGPDLEQMLAENGPLPVPVVVIAAQAAADGLKALAANGIVGPPPALFAYAPGSLGSGAVLPGSLGLGAVSSGSVLPGSLGSGSVASGSLQPPWAVTMGPPLPPALAELEATQGGGTGHEPPEVLGGADWTPAAQVYACASTLWTILSGQPPYADPLARLAATDPPAMRRADVPDEVVATLRRALSAEPESRQATPADLATALRDAAARRLGSLYLLDRPIGKGGGGEVWAGRRKASGEAIAVKLLRTELVEAELGRFVREYHILHQLRHPQLVRVDEFFSEGGVFAIVMDLVRGGNLRQFAARNRLSLTEAASLLAQTADGLAAVHEAGLVHRDIKPENVLVAEHDGQRPMALLSDFGIARPLRDSEHTQVLGTPSYLAPELAMGRAPSQASDIYALGVTAYEILAGHRPFHGDNVDALLLAHIDKVPARPEGLSDQVWQLIAACLDKDPRARPTASKAAAAWAAIAGSRQVPGQTHDDEVTILSAHPAGPEPKPPAPRRKRRLLLAVIATVILGLATGVYLATRQPTTNTGPTTQQFQYPVASTVSVQGTVAVVSWHSDAATMPGFQGYLVFDVTGDRPRALTATMLGADAISFQVDGVRPGRKTCFYVIAVGVTVSPPQQTPPLPCVTPPTAKPTTP